MLGVCISVLRGEKEEKIRKEIKRKFPFPFQRIHIFSHIYGFDFSNTEFEGKRIDPLIVSVFYTKSVFIAESGGNIHCASHFESFKN